MSFAIRSFHVRISLPRSRGPQTPRCVFSGFSAFSAHAPPRIRLDHHARGCRRTCKVELSPAWEFAGAAVAGVNHEGLSSPPGDDTCVAFRRGDVEGSVVLLPGVGIGICVNVIAPHSSLSFRLKNDETVLVGIIDASGANSQEHVLAWSRESKIVLSWVRFS
jgi:hypothetical protein